MRTMKGIPWRMGLLGIVAGAILAVMAPAASAQLTGTCSDENNCKIGTDRPASIVIFPRLVFDSSTGTDTIVQLTNAGERRNIDAICYYVNANGHCSNNGDVCNPSEEPSGCVTGATCVPGWVETDFRLTLTKRQPISWRISEGLPFLPCDAASPDAQTCTADDQGNQIFNVGNIPNVTEDPFIGELKCIQIDESEVPVEFNELKGNATIVQANDGARVDVNKQNAIGVQAIPGRLNDDGVLCLGGEPTELCPDGAEYVGCPQTLIMDHFFDGANITLNGDPITSRLTLIPCAQNFLNTQENLNTRTTVQFLVYNEYEQRFSTSIRIACFEDRQISDIDTRLGDSDDTASLFNVGVQGTLTGQTRIRGVSVGDQGRGLLGQLTATHGCIPGPDSECTSATNLFLQGRRQWPDAIILR